MPKSTATSDLEDVYFQLTSAPTTYSWVVLAHGTMVANANILVMYTSSNNNNSATISPRTATGHSMQTFSDAVNLT